MLNKFRNIQPYINLEVKYGLHNEIYMDRFSGWEPLRLCTLNIQHKFCRNKFKIRNIIELNSPRASFYMNSDWVSRNTEFKNRIKPQSSRVMGYYQNMYDNSGLYTTWIEYLKFDLFDEYPYKHVIKYYYNIIKYAINKNIANVYGTTRYCIITGDFGDIDARVFKVFKMIYERYGTVVLLDTDDLKSDMLANKYFLDYITPVYKYPKCHMVVDMMDYYYKMELMVVKNTNKEFSKLFDEGVDV